MPTDELALVLQAADAWVEKIQVFAGASAEVSREYDLAREDAEYKNMVGRKVWVYPADYTWTPITRRTDNLDCTIVFVVAERYTGAGRIPKAWLDERVLWVQRLWRHLASQRDEGDMWPSGEDGSVEVADVEMLRGFKTFWVSLPPLTVRTRDS